MKLSEAIRKGNELVPNQTVGRYFQIDGHTLKCACAMGMAYIGQNPDVLKTEKLELTDLTNIISDTFEYTKVIIEPTCNVCHSACASIKGLVVHLNDTHFLSPAAIASDLEERGF